MERDFEKDDFELFLQQKADQHKLYPSEKSWRAIYNTLHPGMKWLKIGGTFLFLSTLLFVYHETSVFRSPSRSSVKSAIQVKTTSVQAPVEPAKQDEKPAGLKASPVHTLRNQSSTLLSTRNAEGSSNLLKSIKQPSANNSIATDNPVNGFLLHNPESLHLMVPANVTIPVKEANMAAPAAPAMQEEALAFVKENAEPLPASHISGQTNSGENETAVKKLNWLQEMAAIRLTANEKSKFNLQFYFSPTVSYRRLADNQNSSHSGILNTLTIPRDLNINRYVDQNAAIGVELGSNVLYAVNKKLTLKSGLQLNYSRYNIKAFKFSSEKASIALKSSGPVADTISSYTSLRNFSGYAPEDLQNQYLQVSLPVGAELKLLGNKRLQFSVAGTMQPTFLLYSDTYLLSTNYINYTKEPSLVRKWNLHSSVEAFLSYKTGGLRWQVGPQFRYQLMSSFNDRYPIEEYIFEYGIKFGVSKTLR